MAIVFVDTKAAVFYTFLSYKEGIVNMGELRIASGRLRGRKIKAPSGETTRPLLTRLRKSLADIMRPELEGKRILDLFGGSGAIVFELISNGATSAVIVELDKKAAVLISQNISSLDLDKEVVVLNRDAVDAVPVFASKNEVFDIIMVAPPYGFLLQQKALETLELYDVLSDEGGIIVQRDEREPICTVSDRFQFVRTRDYGRTLFDFYKKAK